MDDATATDPRLRGWRERLAVRANETVEALATVPGVVGLVLGGSYGRGEQWPLSDLDVIVVSTGRPGQEVAAEVDRAAYELSGLWGSGGIYTAIDAGRLTFDEGEVRAPGEILARLQDHRWFHGIDKIYAGTACRDVGGTASELLALSAQWRFAPSVIERRIEVWLAAAQELLDDAERLSKDDRTGAWIAIRRAASAIVEVATERWGERAGSLGRYWTRFEARAHEHGETAFADRLLTAAHAQPAPTPPLPEWLAERIELSYQARLLIGENVTPGQNTRDNLLAYASLYRGRFPNAAYTWMAPPPGVDPRAAIDALRAMAT